MTNSQLAIVWAIAVLLSGVAVYDGIYISRLDRQAYEEKVAGIRSRVADMTASKDADMRRIAVDIMVNEMPKMLRNAEEDYLRQRKEQSLLVGLGIPIVLLGGCAFISVSRKRQL